MTENHIDTVVLDKPFEHSRTDEADNSRNDAHERTQTDHAGGEDNSLLSWLS